MIACSKATAPLTEAGADADFTVHRMPDLAYAFVSGGASVETKLSHVLDSARADGFKVPKSSFRDDAIGAGGGMTPTDLMAGMAAHAARGIAASSEASGEARGWAQGWRDGRGLVLPRSLFGR